MLKVCLKINYPTQLISSMIYVFPDFKTFKKSHIIITIIKVLLSRM